MAIHRWGEGVWARASALAVVALFVIWGSVALYSAPVGLSLLAERGDQMTEGKWDGVIAHADAGGPDAMLVEWLTAQPLGDALIGREAADDVGAPGRLPIVGSGEPLSKEMIAALREAGFNSIPIKGEGKQAVEERIVGVCVLAERIGAVKAVELIAKETIVTSDTLDATRDKLLHANPPLPVRAENQRFKVSRQNAEGAWEIVDLVQAGDLLAGDKFSVMACVGIPTETIAEQDRLIDAALFQRLKEEGILQVAVKEVARLPISPATKSKLLGWHVEAGETVERETFWTAPLFMIPVLDIAFDGGMGVCVLVAVALLAFGWRYFNRPSLVDHLIETQNEMKKVSWPSRKELVGSSMVVIVFIAVVASILFVSDVAFAWLAKVIGIYPEGL